jgi:hypothetical protein
MKQTWVRAQPSRRSFAPTTPPVSSWQLAHRSEWQRHLGPRRPGDRGHRCRTHNPGNPRTWEAYHLDIQDFMRFTGIEHPEDFRLITEE